MTSRVPDSVPLPPDPPVPDPPTRPGFLTHSWAVDLEMIRCGPGGLDLHRPYVSPRPYRFSPLRASDGSPVPTLYAGATTRGALAETVFHDVPPRGGLRSVPYDRFKDRVIGRVLPRRSLKLADFTSDGLNRVGVSPREITETGPATYVRTALWAQAVFDHDEQFDGIYWMSRLRNSGPALMLFGARVKVADLKHVKRRDLEPITAPSSLDTLLGYADDLDIQIAGVPWHRH